MRLKVAVLGTLGVLATVLSLALVLSPTLLEYELFVAVTEAIRDVDSTRLMLGIGLVVLGYLLFAARSGSSNRRPTAAETRFENALSRPPEMVTADRQELAAANLDSELSRAVTEGGQRFENARKLLRQTATHVYAETTATEYETSHQHIEDGTWTTDPLAATTLAESGGPEPSLAAKLRLWLHPERERNRRLERTIEAIVQLQEHE